MTVVGLATSAVGLWVAFRNVHWLQVRAALEWASWPWLALFAALNASTMITRALQLQSLTRRKGGAGARFGPCWRAVTVGMLAQTVLPVHLGEAARVVAIVKDGEVPAPEAVGVRAVRRVQRLVA